MRSKQLLLILFIFYCSAAVRAQRYMGLLNDEWNTTTTMYINPSYIADQHERFVLTFFTANVAVDNNIGKFNNIGKTFKTFNGNDSTPHNVFSVSGRDQINMLAPSAEIRGPGMLIKLSDKHTIAFTTRVRLMNQFTGMDASLYNMVTSAGYNPGIYQYSPMPFTWTAHLWAEAGVSYGRVLYEKERFQLRGGVSVRYLSGMGYVNAHSNGVNVRYYGTNDSFRAGQTDMSYSSSLTTNGNNLFKGLTQENIMSRIFGGNAGWGMGGDVGITMRYYTGNPDPIDYVESNVTHDIIISAALTDIGYIQYKEAYTANFTGNGYLNGRDIANSARDYTSFRNYMSAQGFAADTTAGKQKVYLPTALVLSFDYQIYERFAANLTIISNKASDNNIGNSYYRQITLTPRYNFNKMCIGLPMTYNAMSGYKAGVGFRFAAIILGSDDMLALLSKNAHGFNAYAGLYMPVIKKREKNKRHIIF